MFFEWVIDGLTFISNGVDVVLQYCSSLSKQYWMERMANSEADFTGNRTKHQVENKIRQNHVVFHVGSSLCSQLRNSLVSNDLLSDQKKKRSLLETREI